MATILRTVQWTVLADAAASIDLIAAAVAKTDFKLASSSPEAIEITVPQALMKNRWAAKITGVLSPGLNGTNIRWTIDGLGDKHYEHMVTIAAALPEGALYDHGIPEALAKVSLKVFGRKEIRHLSNVLDPAEEVVAMGVGAFAGKMGIVALTKRRLLFLEKSMLSESLVEFQLAAIGAVSLSKKMGGESLTVSHSGTTAVITTLGHGQGDEISRQFRQLKDAPPAAAPAAVAPDPIEQIERLAGLVEKGLLTDAEFQAKKAELLAQL